MSPAEPSPGTTSNPGNSSTLPQAVGILVAAVLLGLLYNRASPQGIKLMTAPDLNPKRAVPGKPSAVRTGCFNETLSLQWDFEVKPAATPGIGQLAWMEIKPLLAAQKIVLLDARPMAVYKAGHIPGAISLPYSAKSEEMAAFMAAYPKDTALVIYCASTACSRSEPLAARLTTEHGYMNVKTMSGGFAEYLASESQISQGEKP